MSKEEAAPAHSAADDADGSNEEPAATATAPTGDDTGTGTVRTAPVSRVAKRDVEHTRHVVQVRATLAALPLGMQPDEQLRVAKLQPNSPLAAKLFPGDKIIAVNGHNVYTVKQLSKALKHAATTTGNIVMVVQRDPGMHPLPAEREGNIQQRRGGYIYLIVSIDWQLSTMRLGLTIRHRRNRVLVVKTEPRSLSAATLLEGDRVIDVDGRPVSHRDEAKRRIIEALNERHHVTLLVERPVGADACAEVKALLEGAQADAAPPTAGSAEKAECPAPADICRLVGFERERMARGGCVATAKGIVKARPRPPAPAAGRRKSSGGESQSRASDDTHAQLTAAAALPKADDDLKTAILSPPRRTSSPSGPLKRAIRRKKQPAKAAPTTSKIKIKKKPTDIYIYQDTDPKKPLKKVVRKMSMADTSEQPPQRDAGPQQK